MVLGWNQAFDQYEQGYPLILAHSMRHSWADFGPS
jgi:hypothetical protein